MSTHRKKCVSLVAKGLAVALVTGLLLVGATAYHRTAADAATAMTPTAGEPLSFLGWPGADGPLESTFPPDTAQQCAAGLPDCVTAVIAELDRRAAPLLVSCDHRAVFGLTYLRTTEEFGRAAAEPGFFADVPYAITEHAVFASYYAGAADAWSSGNGNVPRAWRIAFEAARDGTVAGTGDLLLGMSAHINRDLPFVLASLGLVGPDGASRKPDHDKVNTFLGRVAGPIVTELSARLDPSIGQINGRFRITGSALYLKLSSWREAAWRNAERLVAATTPQERDQVAESIETQAANTAVGLRDYYALPQLVQGENRDVYCARQLGAVPTSAARPPR